MKDFVNLVVENPTRGFRFANRYEYSKEGLEELRKNLEFLEKLLEDKQ